MAMPRNLSIRQVPDDVIRKLKRRAKKNRRSLQGEVISILEEAATGEKMGLQTLYLKHRSSGPRTLGNSAEIIRELRDAR
jgi:plasmid stability protein